MPVRPWGSQYRLWVVDVGTLVAASLGGVLAIAGGVVSVVVRRWQEQRHWYREHQIQLVGEAMAAAQRIMRIITTIAYGEPRPYDQLTTPGDSPASPGVYYPGGDGSDDLYDAMTEWNSALHRLLISAPSEIVRRTREIDLELDRLLDAAYDRRWSREAFRAERVLAGRLLLDLGKSARTHSGFGDLQVDGESIWTWDDGEP